MGAHGLRERKEGCSKKSVPTLKKPTFDMKRTKRTQKPRGQSGRSQLTTKPTLTELRAKARQIGMTRFYKMKRDTLKGYVERYDRARLLLCDELDAITRERLVWPWFEMHSDEDADGSRGLPVHGFEPVTLAEYYRSTDRFVNPCTQRAVTHEHMQNLDALLCDIGRKDVARNVSLFETTETRRREREQHSNTTLLFERELDREIESISQCADFDSFALGCGIAARHFVPNYAELVDEFRRHDAEAARLKLTAQREYVRFHLDRAVTAHKSIRSESARRLPDARDPDRAYFSLVLDEGVRLVGCLAEPSLRAVIFLHVCLNVVERAAVANTTSDGDVAFTSTVQETWHNGVIACLTSTQPASPFQSRNAFEQQRLKRISSVIIAMHRQTGGANSSSASKVTYDYDDVSADEDYVPS
jgi:hypothetical protein